jgi:hypothetical protein
LLPLLLLLLLLLLCLALLRNLLLLQQQLGSRLGLCGLFMQRQCLDAVDACSQLLSLLFQLLHGGNDVLQDLLHDCQLLQ